ncbi:MAG: choice-of-anchor J domain-containing protein [Bacteroidales bacterium]|nr:choice-of-anchor J domain-containing protein [Bacteroidales bacterium]
MRIRNFVLSLMAAAAMFTACENEEAPLGAPSLSFEQESLTVGKEGGTATLSFTATRDWTVSCDESWVSFKSIEGKASIEPQQLTVTADPNDSYDREAEITFVVGKKLVTKTIILYQTGSGQAPLSGEFYSVDFKKDGISGWEVIDVVKPDDLEAVWTESTSYGMVAKAYANNTNYEAQSWLVSPSIDLSQVQAAHLCFSHAGRYFSDIKKDVTLWVLQEESKAAEDVEAFTTQLSIPVYPVDFTFVESGDIDLSSYAGSSIRLAFKYKSSTSKAGTYEVQNLRISTEAYDSGEGGGEEGGEEGGEDADAIYYNNFDKEEATKTYGSSNNSYPYLDQFEGWKNEQGSGASGVSYLFKGMSARSNSTSDGTYSKYDGSGMNNLFFGNDAYIQVNGIELGESRSLVISFGAEKYLNNGDSNFNKDEFKVYVSDTGKKWVALEYEIGGTEISGTWNLNTSEAFTMPSSKLYIHISASVASAYRLDDLKVVASTEAGKTIDTSNGVDLGTGSGEEGGETGGEEGGEVTLVGAGTLESPYTAADAIALTSKMTANDSMADVYVKGIISSDLVVSLQYGNATFNISDDGRATGEFNIFRALYLGNVKFTSEDQIKIGDEVVLVGTLVNYKGTAPELKDCHIVQLNGDQGGEEGGDEGGNTGGEEGGNTGGEEGGNTGGEEGGNTGGEVDAADYTTTVEYSTISTFDDKGVATINGVSDVKVLKVGSSDAIGSFTLTLPAGTKSVSYYAVGWKGKTTTLKFLQGETEIGTQALVANTGASNSSPFTLTVTDADKYSLDFGSALEEDTKITVTTTAIARALLFGIQAVK